MKKASLVVVPPYDKGEIFNPNNRSLNRDDCLRFYHELQSEFKKNQIDLNTQDINPLSQSEIVLYMEMPKVLPPLQDKNKSYLMLLESELIRPDNWDLSKHEHFTKVFTWDTGKLDGTKYCRLNFSHSGKLEFLSFAQKSKFCTLIAADKTVAHPKELYSERRKVIRWFEINQPADFEFYGLGWNLKTFTGPIWKRAFNRIPIIRKLFTQKWPSYRGPVADKLMTLRQYRFAICYENIYDIPGYITEKIFDCLAAGCIPVYWGAPNIKEFIPRMCFVDRRQFSSNEDLYQYLKGMTSAEYDARLQEIERYLSSPAHDNFTPSKMAMELVREVLASLQEQKGHHEARP